MSTLPGFDTYARNGYEIVRDAIVVPEYLVVSS